MLKEGINNTANTKDGTDGLCLQLTGMLKYIDSQIKLLVVVVVVVVVAMTVHPV